MALPLAGIIERPRLGVLVAAIRHGQLLTEFRNNAVQLGMSPLGRTSTGQHHPMSEQSKQGINL